MYKKALLLVFSLVSLSINAQINRIEPSFWWVGMKNPQLQLLIHGSGICNREVLINYPGVKVLKQNRACSPNYLFVTLQIDNKIAKAGKFDIVLRQEKVVDLKVQYEFKNRRAGSAQRKSFTSADVMYLLMPDRFANGDPTNDNMDSQPEKANRTDISGRHGGDLKGIQEHLDYIKELGATAIWCTPVQENNYSKYTYHGYAISDYAKIDPRYGSNQDYVNMVEASHQKGLKVVMDMVSNHCGIWAWWMADLPFENWIHQWPKFTFTNHKANTYKDIHASEYDKKLFTDGWFDTSMPDMNQQNEYFWNYYIQNSIWWIEYANLDGIRQDTYPYNDREAMSNWCKAITNEYPNFNLVGETWLFTTQDIAFWQKNSVNALKYNSNLPTVMDFMTQAALANCFNEHGKPWEDQGMNRLYNVLSNDYLYADINNLLIFAENHDTQRYNNVLKGSIDKFKMAMSFLMTTRGIPQIYYGSEIGMTGDKNVGDGDVRRDFPGGWAGDAQNAFTAAGRTAEQKAYFDFMAKLLNWRKTKLAIHTGKLTQFVPVNDVYVYFRYNEKERIMVVMNNNESEQKLNLDRYAECLKSSSQGIDVITGKTVLFNQELTIPATTAYILELK